ncbi:MAG: multicopper oxidase domain-containing protein [bacterium]
MALRTVRLRPLEESEKAMFHKHVCPSKFSGGPLDSVEADGTRFLHLEEEDKSPASGGRPVIRHLKRKLLSGQDLDLPNGEDVKMWIIEAPDADEGRRTFPSKPIRVVEGEVIHAKVKNSSGPHTIHWHGIEPSTGNDGVGHTSWEASSAFTYQWQASCAGTYFFHCHKNTVLHFQRGLFGVLIIDPPKPAAMEGPQPPYPNGGPGFVRRRDEVLRYDVEQWWAGGEIDTRWSDLGHDEAMQDCDEDAPVDPSGFTQDGFLNQFHPDVFFVAGVPGQVGLGQVRQRNGLPRIPANFSFPEVAVHARVNDAVLVRVLNAGYTVKQYRIGRKEDAGKLDLEVIATDGRTLGSRSCKGDFSEPFRLEPGEPLSPPFGPLSTARRFDLMIRPRTAGTFPVQMEFYDWRATYTGSQPDAAFLYATAHTSINVD